VIRTTTGQRLVCTETLQHITDELARHEANDEEVRILTT
jgi:hypothetical protein